MSQLSMLVEWANNLIWSKGMLILIATSGLYFTMRLGFFQFIHHFDMWKRIMGDYSSESGISAFSSFCTTMATRIGTGNVAGVAVAIYYGGPGALFWMWVVGMTNSAVCFVECTLGQLYKRKIDGEYRGSSAFCAQYGMGKRWVGVGLSLCFGVGAAFFMPAAATYTISEAFYYAANIPMWMTSLTISIILLIIIVGGIKRIAIFSSFIVPVMTFIYMLLAVIIILTNIDKIPSVFMMIFEGAFGRDAIIGGSFGSAVLHGVKRGTFSSAAGMGEATPAASAAETSHPVKQGLANAAGVWLDTIVVCSCTGFMILLTNCFNTIDGYSGSSIVNGMEGGIIYVQEACHTILGEAAPMITSVTLFLFSFTCIISYYYEAETSFLLLLAKKQEKYRRIFRYILRIVMVGLVFLFGFINSKMAWNLSDLALGAVTWINTIMLWILSPKAFALYKDYRHQMKEGKNPCYNPDRKNLCWKGVDVEMWREIYLKQQKK